MHETSAGRSPRTRDGFRDDDGCRDPQRLLDDDGCADELSERMRTLTSAPLSVAWKPGTAELGPGAAKLLDDTAADHAAAPTPND